jgi:hypothetical protein
VSDVCEEMRVVTGPAGLRVWAGGKDEWVGLTLELTISDSCTMGDIWSSSSVGMFAVLVLEATVGCCRRYWLGFIGLLSLG